MRGFCESVLLYCFCEEFWLRFLFREVCRGLNVFFSLISHVCQSIFVLIFLIPWVISRSFTFRSVLISGRNVRERAMLLSCGHVADNAYIP